MKFKFLKSAGYIMFEKNISFHYRIFLHKDPSMLFGTQGLTLTVVGQRGNNLRW